MEHTLHPTAHPDAIDPSSVDWTRVSLARYLVHQQFSYHYPGRIRDLRHQLMVVPPETFGDQRRTTYSLEVSEPGEVTTRIDPLANTVIDVRVPFVERAVEFEAWVTIERTGPTMPRAVPAAWLGDTRFLTPTRRTTPDAAIDAAAQALRASGAQGLELATLANRWVHETMQYVPGVTGIHTTAATALEARHGVCQDYSHLMIAVCRQLGLPTLYVSGHMLGEGGTHSWVEVLLPASEGSGAAGWPLDPTHGRPADTTYLTVAVGRDYGDVAPTSGSYRAGHGGSLTAHKEVRVIAVDYQG